jgi:5,10-methylenetetrahydromethanopterin reductase
VDYGRLKAWAKSADDLGFAFVAVGDNPGHMRDTYVSLTVLAQATSRCCVGTGTTNPLHRDILVTASAMSSVETLAPGRTFLGLARGRAHMTASVDLLRTYVIGLRELWERGETTFAGKRIRLDWDARPVPILLGASGPRVLQLAGELADGVLVESGVSEDAVAYAMRNLEIGARVSGRDLETLKIWWYVKSSISEDRDEAADQALAPAAASGALVLGTRPAQREVPERFWAGCRRLYDRYDMSAHLSVDSNHPNRRLLDHDPELRRYVMDRFTLTGTPTDWLKRLNQLRAFGVERLYLVAVVPDPAALVNLVGKSIIPRLRAPTDQRGHDGKG